MQGPETFDHLKEFANTPRQLEYINAIINSGSLRAAARHLGVDHAVISRTLKQVRSRAADNGRAPGHFDNGVAPGFRMGKVTVQRGSAGNIERTWERQHPDAELALKLLTETAAALSEELPRSKSVPAPRLVETDLANCYIITDYHLGMYAWAEETGADWDIKIAEDMLVAWFAKAISLAPNSEMAIFAQLGDFLHFDGLEAKTPTHGFILDADTRFQLIVRVAIRVVRRVIAMLLEKHSRVHVIMAEGNHDLASSTWLREMFAAFYEFEPRVSVDLNPDPYYCVEWGGTSLFFHHGHKKKIAAMDTVFAAKFREVFGRTLYSYAHTGHLHSDELHETNLMRVERHRTLASPDSHASSHGWISGRDAKVISYHKEFGEVWRQTISSKLAGFGGKSSGEGITGTPRMPTS